MEEKKFRVESDLLGELQVPEEAYYGVQTQRAINNYHISRKRMCDYPDYVVAIAYVKLAAVETNRQLGEISDEVADAMAQACREIIDGKMHENFVTDMVQGGAGTSVNMRIFDYITRSSIIYSFLFDNSIYSIMWHLMYLFFVFLNSISFWGLWCEN